MEQRKLRPTHPAQLAALKGEVRSSRDEAGHRMRDLCSLLTIPNYESNGETRCYRAWRDMPCLSSSVITQKGVQRGGEEDLSKRRGEGNRQAKRSFAMAK